MASATFIPTSGNLTVVGALDLEAIRERGKPDRYQISVVSSPQSGADAATQPSRRERARAHADRGELMRGVVAGVALLAAFLAERLAPSPVEVGNFDTIALLTGPIADWPLVVALFATAIAFGGYSNFRKGFYSLGRLDFNMGVLMSAAVVGAVLLGEWEEAAVVAFLFSASDYIESWTLARARRSISDLVSDVPKTATVERGTEITELPVESVAVGETIIVVPGSLLPLDGTVVSGISNVNEATITGESVPADKSEGSEVYAGTLNGSGLLRIVVTKPSADTAVARIVQLVEEAQANRPAVQSFIERFAAVYTPVVLALAAAIAVVPPLALGEGWSEWFYRALALLLVSCPCALVVSTPITVVSAISNAARRGVLIKGGAYLEEVGRVRAIAFDKTGTLTQGRPRVADVIPIGGASVGEVLATAAALERHSDHPLARAIVEEAATSDGTTGDSGDSGGLKLDNLEVAAGLGVRATIAQADSPVEVAVGNERFAAQFVSEATLADPTLRAVLDGMADRGHSVVFVLEGGEICGLIGLADSIRDSSRDVIERLRSYGIEHVAMLTGDNRHAAQTIANQAGVDSVRSGLLPADKVREAEVLNHRYGRIAVVGDGVNDAPALAAATVGIAMGGAGSDTALETADVALMGDDLTQLPFLVGLSRTSLATIKTNVWFAIAVKVVAVLLVFPGWLTLWLAILSDMGASILVSLYALRMLGWRERGTPS